jgi:hypothetical protein
MREVAEAGMNGERSTQAFLLQLLRLPIPGEWAYRPVATVERCSSYKASPVWLKKITN